MPGRAVIIGAAQGIGEATARALAQRPWVGEVIVVDLQGDLAKRVAQSISAGGRVAHSRQCDITDTQSVEALALEFPDTEFLAIVAGIAQGRDGRPTRSEFERVLSVNLIGAYLCAELFAKGMMHHRRGSIVAVSSITAQVPRLNIAAYCASKAGLNMALRVLALETVPLGVRINTVSPGSTDTSLGATPTGHTREERAAGNLANFRMRIPDGRVATPDDVANAICFLLGPESAHVSLHDLVVDGGETMGGSA